MGSLEPVSDVRRRGEPSLAIRYFLLLEANLHEFLSYVLNIQRCLGWVQAHRAVSSNWTQDLVKACPCLAGLPLFPLLPFHFSGKCTSKLFQLCARCCLWASYISSFLPTPPVMVIMPAFRAGPPHAQDLFCTGDSWPLHSFTWTWPVLQNEPALMQAAPREKVEPPLWCRALLCCGKGLGKCMKAGYSFNQ